MGKRGPKPKGGYGDKTTVLSTRITADTRRSLQDSANEAGRSLSSEVEHRLRRSFDADRTTIAHLGGPQQYAILRMIAAALEMVGSQAFFMKHGKLGGSPDWLLDAYAYDQALKAAVAILERLRPPGDSSPPSPTVNYVPGNLSAGEATQIVKSLLAGLGKGMATHIVELVGDADPTQPSPADKLPPTHKLARHIASDLGPIRKHISKTEMTGSSAAPARSAAPRRKSKPGRKR